ncbi:hypothetical protein B0H14DRAFT_1187156 [Mycena olivaceomarginata]|nr:hypothetical protein B0H14DRAFT_1187156 [Mycena olivaceomarginata]
MVPISPLPHLLTTHPLAPPALRDREWVPGSDAHVSRSRAARQSPRAGAPSACLHPTDPHRAQAVYTQPHEAGRVRRRAHNARREPKELAPRKRRRPHLCPDQRPQALVIVVETTPCGARLRGSERERDDGVPERKDALGGFEEAQGAAERDAEAPEKSTAREEAYEGIRGEADLVQSLESDSHCTLRTPSLPRIVVALPIGRPDPPSGTSPELPRYGHGEYLPCTRLRAHPPHRLACVHSRPACHAQNPAPPPTHVSPPAAPPAHPPRPRSRPFDAAAADANFAAEEEAKEEAESNVGDGHPALYSHFHSHPPLSHLHPQTRPQARQSGGPRRRPSRARQTTTKRTPMQAQKQMTSTRPGLKLRF